MHSRAVKYSGFGAPPVNSQLVSHWLEFQWSAWAKLIVTFCSKLEEVVAVDLNLGMALR